MKKRLIAKLLVPVSFLISIKGYAGEPSGSTSNQPPVKIEVEEGKGRHPITGGRPKAPSRQHIECWYADGELSFDFAIPEGECTLTVTDSATGFMTSYSFDSSESSEIYVGALANGSAIEIRTETGHTYQGEIIYE